MSTKRAQTPRCPLGAVMGAMVVAIGAAAVAAWADEPEQPYVNEEIGISLTLPGADWELSDHGQGIAKVLVFSPDPKLSTRCSVLYVPRLVLPDGLSTRAGQIARMFGDDFTRVSYGKAQLAGREVDRLEYKIRGATTIEWGLWDGDFYLVLQLSAPHEKWQDPDVRRQLDGIRDSFKRHAGATLELPQARRSTPAEIREKRRKARKKDKQEFQVVSHELHVRIDPPAHSLNTRDRLTVESAKDGLSEIGLFYSFVSIDSVTGPPNVSWECNPFEDNAFIGTRQLVVRLGQPLNYGEKTVLNVETSSSDFLQTIDQKLVTELAVFGQIREESSFSSHVAYYPVDERNDAAVDISLTVPSGYTAVTGGALVEVREAEGWTTFHYRTKDRRHRLLPFGFAAGKFISESAGSGGGLRLTFYGNPGEEEALRQRLDVAVEAAGIFEGMMGPLPWKDVRYAHVTPVSKETGVSLPGLILISDMFFTDITEVDLSDGLMNKSDGLSLLVVVDELSHQWNAYSVPLPNELAEGVSTFTNALFIEHRHGADAYRNAIRFCREAYIAATALDRDVAVADPEIYETTAYRGIAFCKTPVILDMLRTRLGDNVFFAAWRKAFKEFDTRRDGFDVLLEAFNETSGQDLTGFFDQWFFTSGWPKIRMAYSSGDDKLQVTLRQVQDGPPYYLRSELLVRGTAGEARRFPVTLSAAQTALQLDCPFQPTTVVLDPDDRLLKEMVAE